MARRIVNGNAYSEDGWPIVDQGSCTWVNIIGTGNGPQGTVRLQLQDGPPLIVLSAFAADFHVNIEPLRDNDSAAWTSSNSVLGQPGRNNGSNHLGATCMDLNWDGPPEAPAFRYGISKERAYPGDKGRKLDELMAFWDPVIFCGGEWSIRDWMHFQCAAGTYDQRADRPTQKILDFIRDRIRPDGLSTYKRGGLPGTPIPPKPAEPTDASRAVSILSRATGVTSEKAAQILPGVVNGLRDSQCTNVNRIAMWLAQIGHESAGFNATEEYQSGDESTDRWKYKGRTWIQITWKSNYAGLSQWAHGKGLIPTPTYFVDNPKKLAEIQYAGLGPAWYWTVARPQINSLCDKRDLVAVTQAINGGQNGASDRKRRYDMASALGDQLLALTTTTPSTPGDDMAQVPQDQWDRVYRELTQRLPSRSPLRHLGEGVVDTLAGFVLNVDGSQHVEIVQRLAGYGDPDALALLREVAGADPNKYPDRQHDAQLAQAILADTAGKPAAVSGASSSDDGLGQQLAYLSDENARLREENTRLATELAASRQSAVIFRDSTPPVSAATPALNAAPSGTLGQRVGGLVNALDEFGLADALDARDRVTLAATVKVIETKNGAQLS